MNRNRLELLRAQSALNGIDFVEVSADQLTIGVHFLLDAPDASALSAAIQGATIRGGEAIDAVPVLPIQAADWSSLAGKPVLTLHVEAPGDFSTYTLQLRSSAPVLDRFFDHIEFSFKAGCPSTLDCEEPPPACPQQLRETPPIDYQARDFLSFKQALLDFSALRYPGWQERSEADFGVMFAEALASIADDLSYYQDRVAAEATLDTATERRSVLRHARLVDYEPRPACAARALLKFEVAVTSGAVSAGLPVSAANSDGGVVEFETGEGLDDVASYPIRASWNELTPYYFDDAERCLPAGATEAWVEGNGLALFVGQRLLIETQPAIEGNPPLRQLVTLSEPTQEAVDPLVDVASGGKPVTQIRFRDDALLRERDLTRTRLFANLVPATQGRRHVETFGVGGAAPSGGSTAIVRTGANQTPQYLYTLRAGRVAWLSPDGVANGRPRPEVRLALNAGGTSRLWSFRHNLLEAERFEEVFTLDPARYVALGTPPGPGPSWFEYDGDDGDTIRFGDGVFGAIPEEGGLFRVLFRVGGGTEGNVAADTITRIDPDSPLTALATSVSNPFPASGGSDEESADSVRMQAPQVFRAQLFRAVRAEDYEAAAEELPWVQRAGTSFRHTGSWLSVFTAVDPIASEELSNERHLQLIELVDRRRLAGYEAFVPEPRFVSLDLEVRLCARSDAFRADVEAAVRTALSAKQNPDGTLGFFHVDRFTFGRGLERSALQAAIQNVPGVDGVRSIRYRQRGRTTGFVDLPDLLRVGVSEILRVNGDLSRPERGSVRVTVEGGK